MTAPAAQTASIWKDKFAILEEAIEFCGGLDADAVASVHNYIARKYPGFPWERNWYGQIVSARSRLRHITALLPSRDSSTSESTVAAAGTAVPENATSEIVRHEDITRARVFIDRLGGGYIPQAREALEFIEEFGSLARIAPAIDTWNELLEAVGHDEDMADRALQVLVARMTAAAPGLRIATDSEPSHRADAA